LEKEEQAGMRYTDVNDLLVRAPDTFSGGPVALLFMEDPVETNSTIRHHAQIGFRNILVLAADELEISPELEEVIHRAPWRRGQPGAAVPDIVSRANAAMEGRWIYFGYNAEYLFFPFCESRSVGEFTAFVAEERRASVMGTVIDLYAPDLKAVRDAVSLQEAYLDTAGYYATGRRQGDAFHADQVELYGGLRWRYEEHVRNRRRRIDRIALFRATRGLSMDGELRLSDEDFNTYACPWHHSPTAAVLSFRAAKSLATNPGSAPLIDSFMWSQSRPFSWHSQQLLDLGMMEPGQWF
jgi:hypothetical protein